MKLVETYWERLLENSFPVVYPFLVSDSCGHKGAICVFRVFQKYHLCYLCSVMFVLMVLCKGESTEFVCGHIMLLTGVFWISSTLASDKFIWVWQEVEVFEMFFQKAKGVVACCKNLHKVKLQEGGMDLIRYWICIDLASGIEFYTWFFEFCR